MGKSTSLLKFISKEMPKSPLPQTLKRLIDTKITISWNRNPQIEISPGLKVRKTKLWLMRCWKFSIDKSKVQNSRKASHFCEFQSLGLYQTSIYPLIYNPLIFVMEWESNHVEIWLNIVCLFWDSILLYSSVWTWTHYITQTGLELKAIWLSLPNARIIVIYHHTQQAFCS